MTVFLYGVLGALAVEWIEIARVQSRPKRTRRTIFGDATYWVVRVGFVFLGGGMAVAYTNIPETELNSWLAVTVGAAWPTIIGRSIDTLPLPGAKAR
jgi:hypothetical protein